MISLLSCNPIDTHEPGVSMLYGKKVLFLPNTHCQGITKDDPHWQLLMQYEHEIDRCLFFIGKKHKGAFDVIDLVCETFKHRKDKVYFLLCHHDLNEKTERIKRYGYTEQHWFSFPDRGDDCKESLLLLGFLHLFMFQK